VGQELVGAGDPVRVLGCPKNLQGAACVTGGDLRFVSLGMKPALRPVEVGLDAGVVKTPAQRQGATKELLGAAKVPAVDQRVGQKDRKLDGLDRITALLCTVEAALEHADGRFELADHRIGAPECVREVRSVGLVFSGKLERLLEPSDCFPRVTLPESDLAQAREGCAAAFGCGRAVDCFLEERLRPLHVAEAQRQLRVRELAVVGRSLGARGEVVLGDAEAAT
jgi:hypothetical protein